MTILYHGSPKKFDRFQISEELLKHSLDTLAEGMGIYLTESKEMAAGYGEYIYTVEVSSEKITDFTKEETIVQLVEFISNEVNLSLVDYMNLTTLVEGVLGGKISVTKMFKEINDLLDSEASFYEEHSDLITYEEGCIFEKIENAFFKGIKDVIKYYDQSFKKPIYICYQNPENLSIISVSKKEQS